MPQTPEHLIDVASGEVRAPAAVEEECVAGHEPAIQQEALAARGVAGGVQELDLDIPDTEPVTVIVRGQITHRNPGNP